MKPSKRGRPRRTDAPVAIRMLLPGELRRWLRIQAAVEERSQGAIVAEGLEMYRKRAKGRGAR